MGHLSFSLNSNEFENKTGCSETSKLVVLLLPYLSSIAGACCPEKVLGV